MRKARNIIAWFVGLFILLFLISFPIQRAGLMWMSTSLPLTGKVIVIDPGHGGPDGGAEGRDKTSEKEIALIVAKKLRDYLQQAGALVYLTREEDKDLASDQTRGLSARKSEDIRNRLAFIHEKEADLFVTIHLNALPSTKWRGAQTFYSTHLDDNKHLAKMIQAELVRNLENTTRQALQIQNIYLLKYAEVPGALVELGFLSNDEERELLKQNKYQQKLATSIYQGILKYLTEEDDESS